MSDCPSRLQSAPDKEPFDYKECGLCKERVYKDKWLQMGQLKDKTKVCFDCYAKSDNALY